MGKTLTSLTQTKGFDYEVIVVDNCSSPENVKETRRHREAGRINELLELDYNSLFAKGNNIAAGLASSKHSHFLLLNSDVEIKDPEWLSFMLDNHERGVISLVPV